MYDVKCEGESGSECELVLAVWVNDGYEDAAYDVKCEGGKG